MCIGRTRRCTARRASHGQLLAVLVGLALVVEGVDWGTLAHVGHWSVTEHQAVAAVGPVFALVELVAAGQTLLAPVLAGNGLEVVVSALARVLVTADTAGSGDSS